MANPEPPTLNLEQIRAMTEKCLCQYCRQPIEFNLAEFERSGETSAEVIGQRAECPHCGKPTILSYRKKKSGGPATASADQTLTVQPCPCCRHPISPKAIQCPNCGHAVGIRFRLVWEVMCNIALASLIFAIIGWLISLLLTGALSAWQHF